MSWRKDKEPINAIDTLQGREEAAHVDGERETVELAGGARRSAAGTKPLMIVGAAMIIGLGAVVGVKALRDNGTVDTKAKKPEQQQVAKNSTKEFGTTPAGAATPEGMDGGLAGGPAGEVDPAAMGAADGGGLIVGAGPGASPGYVPEMTQGPGSAPPMTTVQAPEPKPLTPAQIAHARRLNGAMGGREGAPSAPAMQDGGGQGEDQVPGELGEGLKPLRLSAQGAGKLANRDYLLTQGAMLDCVLETKIVSSVAGMTSCHLTRDIYSSNGRVVVLDRGSKVVGFYQGGMKQGQPRIFVQWSRVETPKGVIINLDSPGTGSLGEGGLSGFIDNHYAQRFGGAILLSLVDDLGDYFANKNQGRTGQEIQFSNTGETSKEMARVTLENSINIPPTLYKNQGERIAIFVARDLSFQGVYGLVRR